jgi:predicted secreted protein
MAAARAACDGLVIGNDAEADEIAKALEEDEINLEQVILEDEE